MSTTALQPSLSLTGTGITTSYQGGSAVPAGKAQKVRVVAKAVTLAASNSTSALFKLQASPDGVNGWTDVLTVKDAIASGDTPAADQSVTTGSSVTVGAWFSVPAGFPFVRVAGKNAGGAGKAGESLLGQVQLF